MHHNSPGPGADHVHCAPVIDLSSPELTNPGRRQNRHRTEPRRSSFHLALAARRCQTSFYFLWRSWLSCSLNLLEKLACFRLFVDTGCGGADLRLPLRIQPTCLWYSLSDSPPWIAHLHLLSTDPACKPPRNGWIRKAPVEMVLGLRRPITAHVQKKLCSPPGRLLSFWSWRRWQGDAQERWQLHPS